MAGSESHFDCVIHNVNACQALKFLAIVSMALKRGFAGAIRAETLFHAFASRGEYSRVKLL